MNLPKTLLDQSKRIYRRFESIKIINEESNIENIINQFQEDRIEMVKPSSHQPLPTRRHYYPRPSPTSILFEENAINSTLSYDNRSIYEWNIDNHSEYQIITTLHYILIYSTICRIADNYDRKIVEFVIDEFSGQLKGW